MNFNTKPDELTPFNNDVNWEIVNTFRNADGYINSKKVEVSFFDLNDDGSIDDPDIFDVVVAPLTNTSTKYIFLKKESSDQGFSKYNYYNAGSTIKTVTTAVGKYKMKLNELIKDFSIYLNNEEQSLLEDLNGLTSIDTFQEREKVIIDNLIRKSVVSKIMYNNRVMVMKNDL